MVPEEMLIGAILLGSFVGFLIGWVLACLVTMAIKRRHQRQMETIKYEQGKNAGFRAGRESVLGKSE